MQSNSTAYLLRLWLISVALLVVAFGLSLYLGSVHDLEWHWIVELRLPRAILAVAVGAGLSVAGCVLQSVFSNPLCEPYTLGVSSGSALGAVIGATLGLSASAGGLALPALAGALAFSIILRWLAGRDQMNNNGLLLAGVMLGFLGSSLVALWMALADPSGLQSTLFWLLGSLSRAQWTGAWVVLGSVAVLNVGLLLQARNLDAMILGEEDAKVLGLDVDHARKRALVWTSCLIGVCVSAAGMIGFIGLVVPHFARQRVGVLHLRLLLLSMIWGAIALLLADTAVRWIARPVELPVGVLTALIGVPLFMLILLRERRRL